MTVPSGRLQFFALEASDYLERLALIVGRPAAPDPEEVVRLTRALRGASLMAGLAAFAQAAAGLEQIAKAYRESQISWEPARIELIADAVEELKRLTRQAADWSDRDTEAASYLARSLIQSLGTETASSRVPDPSGHATDELKPSVRAFVGREGALVGGTLEHAAQALELGQPGQAVEVVLQRLQPLRGLASLPSLSPLPEFIDAIELTVRMTSETAAPPEGAAALRRAAAAVTRLAREIAETGRTTASTTEVESGADALLDVFGREDDVVDIASLFRAGDAHPIVSQGAPPVRDSSIDSMVELVSLADRFRQAADQIGSTAGRTELTLALYGLVIQLRPLARQAASERPFLRPLLDAVTRAIVSGRARRDLSGLSDSLRAAAERLGQAAQARNAVFLGDELGAIVLALNGLGEPAAAPPAPEWIEPAPVEPLAPVATVPVGPAEPAIGFVPDDESDVVPIEALGFVADDESDVVPIEALAPDFPLEPAARTMSVFERSFSTYYSLLAAPAASERPRVPAAIPVPEPVFAEAIPSGAPTADDWDREVLPISDLLYRGRRALERADLVRIELSGALKARRPFEEIEPLVSELIDLVPLALEE